MKQRRGSPGVFTLRDFLSIMEREFEDRTSAQPVYLPLPGWVRVRLTVSFDGSRYQGWQKQKTGTGVQEVIEAALHRLFPEASNLTGCSRTDAGVHALALVAHFDLPQKSLRIPMRRLPLAMNTFLPSDIRIVRAVRCVGPFHARFSAITKEYRYQVWNHPVLNPLIRHYAWHVPRRLEIEKMREAALYFIGTHDFIAFSTNPGYKRVHTVRTVQRCEIIKRGPLVVFRIQADGFLYRMCRGIVGTLVQVGLGRFTPTDIKKMLESRDRRLAGMSAPPNGLILWRVFYSKAGPGSKCQDTDVETE